MYRFVLLGVATACSVLRTTVVVVATAVLDCIVGIPVDHNESCNQTLSGRRTASNNGPAVFTMRVRRGFIYSSVRKPRFLAVL